jgi:hypothetical protein
MTNVVRGVQASAATLTVNKHCYGKYKMRRMLFAFVFRLHNDAVSTARLFRFERDPKVILYCDVKEADFFVGYLTTLYGL